MEMNFFEERALHFILNCKYPFNQDYMFWSSPFDIIILPIGFYLLKKKGDEHVKG